MAILGMIMLTGMGSRAADIELESAGMRFGFSVNPGTRGDLFQAEAFGDWHLPWDWSLGRQWSLRPRLDLSAGGLTGMADQSFVGTLGPSLVVERPGLPVKLVAGCSPTVLSRSMFGNWDVGTWFQFTTHAGFALRLNSRCELGYRFQHMSNASLDENNPGLNLHMFSLAYRFRIP
jgi:hypothetical protein